MFTKVFYIISIIIVFIGLITAGCGPTYYEALPKFSFASYYKDQPVGNGTISAKFERQYTCTSRYGDIYNCYQFGWSKTPQLFTLRIPPKIADNIRLIPGMEYRICYYRGSTVAFLSSCCLLIFQDTELVFAGITIVDIIDSFTSEHINDEFLWDCSHEPITIEKSRIMTEITK